MNRLEELSRAAAVRAAAAARTVLAQTGLEAAATDAGERLQEFVGEVAAANRANRQLLEDVVAAEVDKAAARWGLVRPDDLEELRDEIGRLQREVIELRARLATPGPPAPAPPPAPEPTSEATP